MVDKLATNLVEPFLRFLLVGSKQVDNVLIRHLCMMEDQIVQMKRWFVNVFKTLPLIDLFRSSWKIYFWENKKFKASPFSRSLGIMWNIVVWEIRILYWFFPFIFDEFLSLLKSFNLLLISWSILGRVVDKIEDENMEIIVKRRMIQDLGKVKMKKMTEKRKIPKCWFGSYRA